MIYPNPNPNPNVPARRRRRIDGDFSLHVEVAPFGLGLGLGPGLGLGLALGLGLGFRLGPNPHGVKAVRGARREEPPSNRGQSIQPCPEPRLHCSPPSQQRQQRQQRHGAGLGDGGRGVKPRVRPGIRRRECDPRRGFRRQLRGWGRPGGLVALLSPLRVGLRGGGHWPCPGGRYRRGAAQGAGCPPWLRT